MEFGGNSERGSMKRKQFTFYASFYEAMSEMNMTARGKAVTILCEYALYGIEPPQMKGALKMYVDLVRPNLEASRKKALAGHVGAGVTNRKRSGKKEKENENENEIEIEKENEIERECDTRAGFERFWDLYPVKIGKEDAWLVWKQKKPDAETACQCLQSWCNSKQWNKDGSHFIPRAAKFLEQEYYLQKPEIKVPMGATGLLGQAELEALERIMREE